MAVADLHHFVGAAGPGKLSQAVVSHRIALFEEEAGAKLLNRAARRVSLTVAGEVFGKKPDGATLPTRDLLVIDHPQTHHGAARRAMLRLLERTFPLRAVPSWVAKTAG